MQVQVAQYAILLAGMDFAVHHASHRSSAFPGDAAARVLMVGPAPPPGWLPHVHHQLHSENLQHYTTPLVHMNYILWEALDMYRISTSSCTAPPELSCQLQVCKQ